MNYFLTIFLLLFSSFVFGQTNITIFGKIVSEQNEPLKDVKIYLSTHNKQISRSNNTGNYTYTISGKSKGEITFNHVGYEQFTLAITKKLLQGVVNDSLNINITLKTHQLREVVVGGKQKPLVMYGSQQNSVDDYVFIDDKILLLSYSKSIEKDPVLKLVSKNQKLISEYNAPKNAISLFTDYENKNYLICKYNIYFITLFKNTIRLRDIDKKKFNDVTSKIIDTLNKQYIYSNFSNAYPAFDFFHQHITKQTPTLFHHIEDQFMMDLYRSEYKYANTRDKLWALRQEVKTGIDKEIWIGARDFTGNIYYKTLYAPLVLFNDTIRIFDHYKDMMVVYDSNYKAIDSASINYHKSKDDKRNWEQPLVKDKSLKQLYALYLAGGFHYLKHINLQTGKTNTAFKLYYKYSENVKVKDGYVYYIYRPYESIQRKYLYREKIETD